VRKNRLESQVQRDNIKIIAILRGAKMKNSPDREKAKSRKLGRKVGKKANPSFFDLWYTIFKTH